MKLRSFLRDPRNSVRIHLCLACAWSLGAIPVVLFLSSSIAFLVFVSVYANIAGEFSAMEAARGMGPADLKKIRLIVREEIERADRPVRPE